jgi:hypothetical protein
MCVPSKNNILLQVSKIMLTVSPFYGVNSSIGTVLEIFSEKRSGKTKCENARRLKGTKLKTLFRWDK